MHFYFLVCYILFSCCHPALSEPIKCKKLPGSMLTPSQSHSHCKQQQDLNAEFCLNFNIIPWFCKASPAKPGEDSHFFQHAKTTWDSSTTCPTPSPQQSNSCKEPRDAHSLVRSPCSRLQERTAPCPCCHKTKREGSLGINPVHPPWLAGIVQADIPFPSPITCLQMLVWGGHNPQHLPWLPRLAECNAGKSSASGLVLAVFQAWVPTPFPTETSGTACPCSNTFRDQALMPRCCCLLSQQKDITVSSSEKAEEHLIPDRQQATEEGIPLVHWSLAPSLQAGRGRCECTRA